MGTDITEQRGAEQRMQHMAHHDSLTGLPNRLLFNDRMAQAIVQANRESSQFALLYVDLDKFKPVNDTFGHDAGDQLLTKVADRIRELVRESDTVARLGGDEFAVILRDISSRDDVAAVSRKIIAAISLPFYLGTVSQTVEIGTSIGIAVYPGDAQDHDTLIKLADAAMYRAKSQSNCFRFFEL
jgi:diguanylate cyclase (GGDEF)-like protein